VQSGRKVHRGGPARVQRERRYLFPSLPRALAPGAAALIEERYLAGTGLSLRRTMTPADATGGFGPRLTLGQRVRTSAAASERVTLTDALSAQQYALLAALPADVLVWRRYDVLLSGRPCWVDVYSGDLHGLVLAEAAFSSPQDAATFPHPVYAVAEITSDERFSGWALAHTSAGQLAALVAEYGMLLR
jgi:CYTH domain-containing protein